MVRQYIMMGACGRTKPLISWLGHKSKKEETRLPTILFKDMLPNDPKTFTRLHLLCFHCLLIALRWGQAFTTWAFGGKFQNIPDPTISVS
jgi:hypothetical protein